MPEEAVAIDREVPLIENRSPAAMVVRAIAVVVLAGLAILVLLPAALAAQAAAAI